MRDMNRDHHFVLVFLLAEPKGDAGECDVRLLSNRLERRSIMQSKRWYLPCVWEFAFSNA